MRSCPYCGGAFASDAGPARDSDVRAERPVPSFLDTGDSSGLFTSDEATSGKRVPAALLSFFLGALGVHQFFLGHVASGAIRLAILVFTAGLAAYPLFLISFIETVIYLTKSDAEFDRIYVHGGKSWF